MSAFDKRVEDFFAHYQDRGMLKWEGFFLSDHREQLAKARKTNAAPAFKPEMMSQEEAANALYLACFSEKQVKVVLSQVDSEGNFKTVTGRVSTDQEGGILIGQQKLDLDEIVQVIVL
ncbi:hypothetical protein [Lactobacillus equicursoris]|uniref:hypothetical protein n=1 Tax=Lactobacillus equicursoris TaxID=420645 RepID=UPI00242D7D48|nr:hypothetical protein [Lactobacillus equicursoris]MDD6386573.1 hypothetical protein [Lactobacillus equicursoris]